MTPITRGLIALAACIAVVGIGWGLTDPVAVETETVSSILSDDERIDTVSSFCGTALSPTNDPSSACVDALERRHQHLTAFAIIMSLGFVSATMICQTKADKENLCQR